MKNQAFTTWSDVPELIAGWLILFVDGISFLLVRQQAVIVSHDQYSPRTELTNAFGTVPGEGRWNILRATRAMIPWIAHRFLAHKYLEEKPIGREIKDANLDLQPVQWRNWLGQLGDPQFRIWTPSDCFLPEIYIQKTWPSLSDYIASTNPAKQWDDSRNPISCGSKGLDIADALSSVFDFLAALSRKGFAEQGSMGIFVSRLSRYKSTLEFCCMELWPSSTRRSEKFSF